MRRLAVLPIALLVGCPTDPGGDPSPEPPTHVSASGHAFDFSFGGGRIEGEEVRILELPDLAPVVTDADGYWVFDDLEVGSKVTFVMDTGDRPPIQTGTFTVPPEDLERITFQSPTWELYDLMADFAGLEADPDRCQIATTVTRREHSLYDGHGTHGEPGATVTIDPGVPADSGPVYFNLVQSNVIYPDPTIDWTTDDGGVLFGNVEPGTYLLEAHKSNTTFRSVEAGCRPGVLTNPSPPWGLQVLTGGLDPREE